MCVRLLPTRDGDDDAAAEDVTYRNMKSKLAGRRTGAGICAVGWAGGRMCVLWPRYGGCVRVAAAGCT